jgi:hypothetical protein
LVFFDSEVKAMTRKKQSYIKGSFTHRRTESDYMGVLLDAVTLDDWRGVVSATVTAAKSGDSSARAWLAQYLVGKPAMNAPAPLTVVVQQLSGNDPVAAKLASPLISRIQYPTSSDEWKDSMTAQITDELRTLEAQKSNTTENLANVGGTRLAAGNDAH